MKKVEFTEEELQIVLQCIYACKFDGKHVVSVGQLIEKINGELAKSSNIGK